MVIVVTIVFPHTISFTSGIVFAIIYALFAATFRKGREAMVYRRSIEIRNSKRPIDRMESIQGEAILKSYRHGDHYFDVASGLHWSIEKESPGKFLARVYKPNSDDIVVVERTEGVLTCYKHGEDQSHPISLGADSPELKLLESKMRYPQLLARPQLWKKLA